MSVYVKCVLECTYYDNNYDSYDYHDPNLVTSGIELTKVFVFPSVDDFATIRRDPRKHKLGFLINPGHEMLVDKIASYQFLTARTIKNTKVYKELYYELP